MATIKEVAQRAGVSVTTVSRVLNKRGYISQEMHDKIYATMEELNYQPNEVARSLTGAERKSSVCWCLLSMIRTLARSSTS